MHADVLWKVIHNNTYILFISKYSAFMFARMHWKLPLQTFSGYKSIESKRLWPCYRAASQSSSRSTGFHDFNCTMYILILTTMPLYSLKVKSVAINCCIVKKQTSAPNRVDEFPLMQPNTSQGNIRFLNQSTKLTFVFDDSSRNSLVRLQYLFDVFSWSKSNTENDFLL